jgi:hypothetical protein
MLSAILFSSVMHGGSIMARKNDRRGIGWRVVGWGAAYALLLVPLLAGWPWTLSDYVFAATVFAIVGGTFELAVRKSGNIWYRFGVALALATAFLLVWINGAAGIIGSENNPANLMFFVVIAIGIAGSTAVRCEAAGMARAMTIAAFAELMVAGIVFAGRLGASEPPGLAGVLAIIAFFACLLLLSAWSFRKAAH